MPTIIVNSYNSNCKESPVKTVKVYQVNRFPRFSARVVYCRVSIGRQLSSQQNGNKPMNFMIDETRK